MFNRSYVVVDVMYQQVIFHQLVGSARAVKSPGQKTSRAGHKSKADEKSLLDNINNTILIYMLKVKKNGESLGIGAF